MHKKRSGSSGGEQLALSEGARVHKFLGNYQKWSEQDAPDYFCSLRIFVGKNAKSDIDEVFEPILRDVISINTHPDSEPLFESLINLKREVLRIVETKDPSSRLEAIDNFYGVLVSQGPLVAKINPPKDSAPNRVLEFFGKALEAMGFVGDESKSALITLWVTKEKKNLPRFTVGAVTGSSLFYLLSEYVF